MIGHRHPVVKKEIELREEGACCSENGVTPVGVGKGNSIPVKANGFQPSTRKH